MRFVRHLRHALFMALACAGLFSTSWAQTPNAPIGNRDGVTASGSTFFTWGWTCDPDAWWTPLAVHFYIDGTYATGTFAGAVTANVERGDVVNVCGGTTAHGYGFYVPSQFLSPGTHYIYAYALDNGGAGPNPLLGASPLSYTVAAPPPAPPSCSSSAPQAATTTATSGAFDVFAYGVQNATSVLFPTWADASQRDLVWYSGTNLGNGTWKASINMGEHFTGNPIYGTFYTHVYVANASYGYTYCSGTGFQRVQPQPQPPTCTGAAPQAGTTTAISGTFDVYAYGVQNATAVLFPTWADPYQRDIVWYPGTNLGNGTWKAAINMGEHFTGNPIYGTFYTHVYGYNASYGYAFCTGFGFQRTQVPATYSISGRTGTPGSVVSIGGNSVVADASGAYSLTGLSAGTYQVSAHTSETRCSIVPASLSVAVGPDASNANFTTQCEKTWDPLIAHNPSQYRACDQNSACSVYGQGAPAWVFSNSNEVGIPPNSPTQRVASLSNDLVDVYMTKALVYKGDGTFKVVLGMNKDSDPYSASDNNVLLNLQDGSSLGNNQQVWFSTTYATAFFEDNYDVNGGGTYPTLSEDLWVDVRAKLSSHAVSIDPPNYTPAGPMAGFPLQVSGMSRLTVGITAEWNNHYRFLEIVLWRDAAYDSCVGTTTTWWGTTGQYPCDTTGLYDRRASWGDGELVYFYGPSLSQVYSQVPSLYQVPVPQPLSIGGTNTYSLPITSLFQWYYGGGRADLGGPASWGDVKIHGVYLGIEMWGKARTTVEIDNYRLYAMRR